MLALFLCVPIIAHAATLNDSLVGTNGNVDAIVSDGTDIYIGGSFTLVGRRCGGGVPFDATTGALPSNWPKVAGIVHAVVPDGTGGWYIGGTIRSVGGLQRNGIAHILADGSVGPFNPSVDSAVFALVLSETTLYAGGSFLTVNTNATPKPRLKLAAFDTTLATNNATNFDPSPNGGVNVLALSGTTLYAGGAFTSVNTNATPKVRNYLAAFDTTVATNNATTFDPDPNSFVHALIVAGNTLYAGGYFSSVNNNTTPKTRNSLAAFDTTLANNNATAFDPALNGGVMDLVLSGTTLYAGGYFNQVNTNAASKNREHVAAFDTSVATNNATNFDPSIDYPVLALAMSGSTLYAGGYFTTVNTNATPKTRNNLAAFDTTISTNNATDFDPSVGNIVYSLAQSGNWVYAGGLLSIAAAVPRNRLAAIDAATGAVTDFNPSLDYHVFALHLSGNILYAGGEFSSVNTNATPKTRSRLAAFDTKIATDNATSFDPGLNDTVKTLAMSGNTLYAGGYFDTVNTNATPKQRRSIAAFDTTIAEDNATNFDPGVAAGGTVEALLISGNILYAGGSLYGVNANATYKTREGIAAFDTTKAVDNATDFDPSTGWVSALLLSGTTLYAGGSFNYVNQSVPRKSIAAFDTTIATNNVTTFDPSVDGQVYSLAMSGTTLYAGGTFFDVNTNSNSKARAYSAAFDTTLATDNATGLDLSTNSIVTAFSVVNSTLYAGGGFIVANNSTMPVPAPFLMALSTAPPTTIASPPGGNYSNAQIVTLTCSDNAGSGGCAGTWYSTDGSNPTISYTGPIGINSTTTLKFYSKDNDGNTEAVKTEIYTFPGLVVGGSSKCFIATAAYGTPMASEVRYLRAFRDQYLLTSEAGRQFVDMYYRYSPAAADWLRSHDGMRAAVRSMLSPLVALSRWMVSEKSYEAQLVVAP